MALQLLVDTCVWLDLARDNREEPTIEAIHDLVASGEIDLIVPEVVLEEFQRCKERVMAEAKRSLQTQFQVVRDEVSRFGHDSIKAQTLKTLGDIDHKIALQSEVIVQPVDRVERLSVVRLFETEGGVI